MAEISMIVPVYQVEPYIAQCIESVLHQTFSDFELILVDDGSTDRSGSICDRYATEDSRIRVIHTTNRGAAAARNTGLDLVSGAYITFLDGDDYLDEHMLERLHEVIQHSFADVVVCDFLNIHSDEKDDFCVHLKEQTVNSREVLEHLKNQRNHGTWTIVWNKIYRKSVLEDIRFPEGRYFEDEFFSNYLYQKDFRIDIIPDVLCYHRVLSSSTMNTQKEENYLDLLDAFQERLEIYLSNDYSADETFKVLIFLLEPLNRCIQAKFQGIQGQRVKRCRQFVKHIAKVLKKRELSMMKKCSLILLQNCPILLYRAAIQFQSRLEKFL